MSFFFCCQKDSIPVRANKLAVSYGRHFRFEAALNHERRSSPMYHNVEAKVRYPGRTVEAGVELGDRGGEVKIKENILIYYVHTVDK